MEPTIYQIWKHRAAPEWWVVRIEFDTITGSAGQYPPGTPLGELADMIYDDHPDDLEWFIRYSEEFEVVTH